LRRRVSRLLRTTVPPAPTASPSPPPVRPSPPADLQWLAARQRVYREIEVMCALPRHRNVLGLRHVCEQVEAHQSRLFLVLDIATGGNLFDLVPREAGCDQKTAAAYFRQLLDGVAFCHDHGVAHRDLKLENVLVADHGAESSGDEDVPVLPVVGEGGGESTAAIPLLKIADFGLSAILEVAERVDGATAPSLGTGGASPSPAPAAGVSDLGTGGSGSGSIRHNSSTSSLASLSGTGHAPSASGSVNVPGTPVYFPASGMRIGSPAASTARPITPMALDVTMLTSTHAASSTPPRPPPPPHVGPSPAPSPLPAPVEPHAVAPSLSPSPSVGGHHAVHLRVQTSPSPSPSPLAAAAAALVGKSGKVDGGADAGGGSGTLFGSPHRSARLGMPGTDMTVCVDVELPGDGDVGAGGLWGARRKASGGDVVAASRRQGSAGSDASPTLMFVVPSPLPAHLQAGGGVAANRGRSSSAGGPRVRPSPRPPAPVPPPSPYLTRLKTVVGSPFYVAPEVLNAGASGGYDAVKADSWSLGVILHAIAAGALPFQEHVSTCPRFQRFAAWTTQRDDAVEAAAAACAARVEELHDLQQQLAETRQRRWERKCRAKAMARAMREAGLEPLRIAAMSTPPRAGRPRVTESAARTRTAAGAAVLQLPAALSPPGGRFASSDSVASTGSGGSSGVGTGPGSPKTVLGMLSATRLARGASSHTTPKLGAGGAGRGPDSPLVLAVAGTVPPSDTPSLSWTTATNAPPRNLPIDAGRILSPPQAAGSSVNGVIDATAQHPPTAAQRKVRACAQAVGEPHSGGGEPTAAGGSGAPSNTAPGAAPLGKRFLNVNSPPPSQPATPTPRVPAFHPPICTDSPDHPAAAAHLPSTHGSHHAPPTPLLRGDGVADSPCPSPQPVSCPTPTMPLPTAGGPPTFPARGTPPLGLSEVAADADQALAAELQAAAWQVGDGGDAEVEGDEAEGEVEGDEGPATPSTADAFDLMDGGLGSPVADRSGSGSGGASSASASERPWATADQLDDAMEESLTTAIASLSGAMGGVPPTDAAGSADDGDGVGWPEWFFRREWGAGLKRTLAGLLHPDPHKRWTVRQAREQAWLQ